MSDISDQEELHVSDIKHKAVIEVNEEGSEAAAVSSIQIDTRSGGILGGKERLVFDRPFLFVIQDVEHKLPLFMGRVVDPSNTLRNFELPESFNTLKIQSEEPEEFGIQKFTQEQIDCLNIDHNNPDAENTKVLFPCKGKDKFE